MGDKHGQTIPRLPLPHLDVPDGQRSSPPIAKTWATEANVRPRARRGCAICRSTAGKYARRGAHTFTVQLTTLGSLARSVAICLSTADSAPGRRQARLTIIARYTKGTCLACYRSFAFIPQPSYMLFTRRGPKVVRVNPAGKPVGLSSSSCTMPPVLDSGGVERVMIRTPL